MKKSEKKFLTAAFERQDAAYSRFHTVHEPACRRPFCVRQTRQSRIVGLYHRGALGENPAPIRVRIKKRAFIAGLSFIICRKAAVRYPPRRQALASRVDWRLRATTKTGGRQVALRRPQGRRAASRLEASPRRRRCTFLEPCRATPHRRTRKAPSGHTKPPAPRATRKSGD